MFDPKLEVPSLELCQRLKELGYPQTCGFYWAKFFKGWDNNERIFEWEVVYWEIPAKMEWQYEYCKAPTCRELGEWLPKLVLNKYSLYYTQAKDGWIIDYASPSNPAGDKLNWEADYTEPNARARMIIWLRENGYIDFNENVAGNV